MSTPQFIPQDSASLTQVRLYTALDPYYYTIDNRPLQDLIANQNVISGGGGDSARRAVLLAQLATTDVFRTLFDKAGAARTMSGLEVSYFSTDFIRVAPGAIYERMALNEWDATSVFKQALSIKSTDIPFTKPTVAGQSIIHIVATKHVDLIPSVMDASELPYLDKNNGFLPGLLLNGELVYQVFSGAAATTGSEIAPIVDAGWNPLYRIHTTNGVANPVVTIDPDGPSIKSFKTSLDMKLLATGSATETAVGGVNTPTFANAVQSAIGTRLSIPGLDIHPNADIKFKILFSGTTSGGAFKLNCLYNSVAIGSVVTGAAATSGGTGTADYTAGANQLDSFDEALFSIPASAFAGFLNNKWTLTKDYINLQFQRDGAHADDTNTGSLLIHDIVAFQ